MDIFLEPISSSTIDTYISIGTKSYNEHYPHLWKNGDTSVYISKIFTKKVVENELADDNIAHFFVNTNNTPIGIVKLIKNCAIDEFSSEESLLAEKIYLLKSCSGKGFGKMILQHIEDYAKNLKKKVIWLDTMQKGNPINFYLKNGFQIKKESELTLAGAKPSEKAMWILTKQL